MMKRFSRILPGMLLLLPSLAGTVVFLLLPLGKTIAYSFSRGLENGRFVGLQNYIDLSRSTAFRLAVSNSIRFYLIALPLILILPLIPALLFERTHRLAAMFDRAVYAAMLLAGASLMTFTDLLFAPNGMLADEAAALFGMDAARLYQSEFAFPLLILLYIYKYGGYNYFLYAIALSRIPRELYEQAHLDGSGMLQTLRCITLPSLTPTAALTMLLSVLHSYRIYREAFLIGGYYPHESIYLLQHFMSNNFVNMNYNRLCCVSVLLLIVVILLAGAVIAVRQLFWRRK